MKELNEKSIIILDGTFEEIDIKFNHDTHKNEIICLDYESHKKIESLGISHFTKDDFLNSQDYQQIFENSMKISKTWYENNDIKELIKINDLNIGWLLEFEFYFYLLKKITLFKTLQKINEKRFIENIHCTENLNELVQLIFENKKILLIRNKNNIKNFRANVFSIKFNIGRIPIVLRINRKKFFKLRDTYEKKIIPIINCLFANKKKLKSQILLIDFNPSLYEKFLHLLSKEDKEILLLNRRRQAVYNIKSLLAIKKSKAKIISYNELFTKRDHENFKKCYARMTKNLNIIFEIKSLKNNFKMDNIIIFSAIKNDLKNLCKSRLHEIIYEYIGSQKLFEKYKPKVILHHYAGILQEKIIVGQGNKKNIPDINFQHGGIQYLFDGSDEWNKFNGHFPIFKNSKFLAWGKNSKELAHRLGMSEKNILDLGCARYDEYVEIKNNKNNKKIEKGSIVVPLGAISQINAQGQKIQVYQNYEKAIKEIFSILKTIKDRKKIVKLHPNDFDSSINPIKIIKKIDPTIKIETKLFLGQIFKDADLVITIQPSTIILEANLFEIPVITLLADPQFEKSILTTGSTNVFTINQIEEFKKYFTVIMNNPIERKNQIEKGNEFVKTYLNNIGNASKEIISELRKYQ